MPERIQLRRTKGWRMPPNTVSVARPGRWGNRFKVCERIEQGGVVIPEIPTVTDAVRLHQEWLVNVLRTQPDYLQPLRGKNLACWCAISEPCHGNTLLWFANASPAEIQKALKEAS